MQQRISDASFTVKDGEGNDQTVDGGLYIDVQDGNVLAPGSNYGQVYFQSNAEGDSAPDEPATDDAPPPQQQQ